MSIGMLYVGLLILGVVYAVIAGALGWLSDLGHADVHMDAGGHLDAGHAHPVSGTTIATFITGFGAVLLVIGGLGAVIYPRPEGCEHCKAEIPAQRRRV